MYFRGKGGIRDGSGVEVHSGYLGLGDDGWFSEATKPAVSVPSLDPSVVGRALSEAIASGKKSVQGYADKAAAFYQDFVKQYGYGKSADIAQYFFMQGTELTTNIGNNLAASGLISSAQAQQINNAAQAARGAVGAGFSLALGEGGSMDKVKDVDTLIRSTAAFAIAVGANEEATNMIMQWGTTATGCVTMIMANVAWGSVGCAAQIILNFFSTKAPVKADTPRGIPHVILRLANSDVSKCVASDALLLAQVLHYHYDLQSTEPLWRALRFENPNQAHGENPPVLGSPPQTWYKTREVFGGDPTSSVPYPTPTDAKTDAVPGVDLLSMMAAVTALDPHRPAPDWRNMEMSLHAISGLVCTYDRGAEPTCDNDWNISGADKLFALFRSDSDVTQAIIATGASLGRGHMAAGGKCPDQSNPGQPGGVTSIAGGYGNWLPFVRVDELINYFVACSLNLRRQNYATWVSRLKVFMQSLPVQWYSVLTGTGKAYSSRCWSNLTVGAQPGKPGIPRPDCNGELINRLIANPDDMEAQREYAALRLMAAFSYLIFTYKATVYSTESTDLIAALPKDPPNSVAWQVQAPCDPRQVYWAGGDPDNYRPNDDGGNEIGPWNPPAASFWKVDGGWGHARLAGVKLNNTDAVRTYSTRDGRWLAGWVAGREAKYKDAVKQGYTASAAVAETSILPTKMVSSQFLSLVQPYSSAGLLAPAKAQMMLKEKPVAMAEIAAACAAGGGYYETSTGYCKPTAETEAACRATGGTPYWDPVNKYKCLAKGQAPPASAAGGGVAGIVVLAGAALLLARLMK